MVVKLVLSSTPSFEESDPPLVMYLTEPTVSSEIGSCYKYHRLIKWRLGGVPIRGNHRDFDRAIRKHRPDVCIVRGDWRDDWRVPWYHRIPYIVEQHDVHSWRTGDFSRNERNMLENAAGVFFTSTEHRDYCRERYEIPDFVTVPLKPLKEQLAFAPLPKLPGLHLAYAGGIVAAKDAAGPFGYRYYLPTFREFIAQGWTVHVYPGYCDERGPALSEYRIPGIEIHPPVSESQLPRELSRYTAGLQGYAPSDAASSAFVQSCRPNKLWLYLAAGIPTIGVNPGRGGAVYDGKWGIVPERIDASLPDRIASLDLDRYRFSEVIDGHQDALVRLVVDAAK